MRWDLAGSRLGIWYEAFIINYNEYRYLGIGVWGGYGKWVRVGYQFVMNLEIQVMDSTVVRLINDT